jgi:hypothetical protein
MLKQSCFDFPDHIRERVIMVAGDEFAGSDCANLAISRIVERAGIGVIANQFR